MDGTKREAKRRRGGRAGPTRPRGGRGGTVATAAWAGAALALAGAPGTGAAQTPTDIHVIPIEVVDGAVRATGAPRAVTDRDGYDNQPQFEPDGGSILYTSIRDGQADTYRHDLETGATERVTATPESEYSPTPMPGGGRFSVVRVEADSTQRLWSFAMDGSDPTLVLAAVRGIGYHAWATPERVVLFVLGDPATLQVADIREGRARQVASGIGRSIQPAPAGRGATFTQRAGDDWWLREVDVERDTIRTVARLPGPDVYHAWGPGRALLSARDTRILQYDPAAREWRTVIDLADAGLGTLTRLAVSPAGDRIAVVADRPPDGPDVEDGTGEDAASGAAPARRPDPAAGPEAGRAAGPGRPPASLFAFASLVVGSLLAMVNPFGALTIFVGLTAEYTPRHRRMSALWACVTAVAILLVFALFGTVILRFFGITTDAFRIAGGILFFGIGWDMLQAKRSRSKTTPEEEEESASRHEVAVVPLGIPTLAGPGAITTVIALMGQTAGAAQATAVYMGVLAVGAVSFLVLLAGPAILRLMGQTGINVFTRLMGLLVMVIGVQFVIDGVRSVAVGLLRG